MENTERKQEVMNVREGLLELCIDHDHVTIPISRFEELKKAEVWLEIVHRAYVNSKTYELPDKLSLLFGPLPEKGEGNA